MSVNLLAQIPDDVLMVLNRLVLSGYDAALVGGAVRDIVRGVAPHDFDVATSARPEDVQRLFPHVVPTGIKHGTVTVMLPSHPVEVTTFRNDGKYTDGRRPDEIKFASSLEEDLERRDFTVNAMALRPTGQLVDPFGGRLDLQTKVLRAVGSAADRFNEDGLRVVRAARFAAVLDLTPAEGLETAMKDAGHVAAKVAVERFLQEMVKLFEKAHRPSIGLSMLHRTRVLERFIPQLAGTDLPLAEIDTAKSVPVRFAVMLTEALGGDNVRDALTDLKASSELVRKVTTLVQAFRDIDDDDAETPSKVRQAVRRAGGLAGLPSLLEMLGSGWIDGRVMAARVSEIVREGFVESTKELALDGHDLEAFGFKGRAIGEAQRQLMEIVDEEPHRNTKEELHRFL